MRTYEITETDLQATMPDVFRIVLGWCEDSEEATNHIVMCLENYVYDLEGGCSPFAAFDELCYEIGVEADYLDEIYMAVCQLDLLGEEAEL